MLGTSLSRWTLTYFAAALAVFLGAQAMMAAGWAYPALSASNPLTLVAVHLLAIGWLTVLILGALHQFVPMVTAGPASNRVSTPLALGGICAGLAGMAIGFLSLGGLLPASAVGALPAGGMVVLLATLFTAVRLARPLWRTRPHSLSARFVLAGSAFLLATVGLGVTFAAILACPARFPWGTLLAAGITVHLTGGLVGWFGLTTLGVSYRLLAMFMPASEDRGRLGDAAFLLVTVGLAVAWLCGLCRALDTPLMGILIQGGEALTAVGMVLYLADVVRLYRCRRRHALELHSRVAALASLMLAAAIALFAALRAAGRLEALAGPLLYLFVFGWLSGLALGQLLKLVPFLTWLERYGSLLGRASVPRVEQLVDERRAAPWFALYFAAVIAGTGCGLFDQPTLWRLAIALHLLASLGIVVQLWRARFRTPRPVTAPAPRNRNRQTEAGALS